MKINLGQAKAAAEWWAEKIGGTVKFDNLGPTLGANAQETERNIFGGVLAGMVAERNPVTPDQLERFKAALIDNLIDGECNGRLGVEYGPDRMLADAADKAGISASRFPWKTHMRFDGGKVTAAHGYGAPWETIYTEDKRFTTEETAHA